LAFLIKFNIQQIVLHLESALNYFILIIEERHEAVLGVNNLMAMLQIIVMVADN
jgi:hypothetical protein